MQEPIEWKIMSNQFIESWLQHFKFIIEIHLKMECTNQWISFDRGTDEITINVLIHWIADHLPSLHIFAYALCLETDNLCLIYYENSKIWACFNCGCISGKIIERWKVHLFAILFTFSFFLFFFQICKDKCSKMLIS